MWCQTICGLFYENKSSDSSNKSLSYDNETATNDEKMEVSKSLPDKQLVDNEQESSDIESTEEVNLNLNNKNKNESKLLEQVVNRLKSRSKARIVLQETINSLSIIHY